MKQGFESLEVFQRAYRISLEIHRMSLNMPKEEQYALADQIRSDERANPFVQISPKDMLNAHSRKQSLNAF